MCEVVGRRFAVAAPKPWADSVKRRWGCGRRFRIGSSCTLLWCERDLRVDKTEREHLKESLRDTIAESGLDLETPYHWVVSGVQKPDAFFAALPSLLPADSILY